MSIRTSSNALAARAFATALGAALLALFVALGFLGAFAAVTGVASHTDDAPVEVGSTLVTAYETGWESPAFARQALESQTQVLSRIAAEHGGAMQIRSTRSSLRTRNGRGARLAAPLARFERTFELRLAAEHDAAAIRSALREAQFHAVSGAFQAATAGK
jgi:hypothetical protein